MSTKNIRVQEAIPSYYDLTVESWDDVVRLGRENMDYLIRYVAPSTRGLERSDEIIRLLEGKTVEDFNQLALQYDDPAIPEETLTVPRDSWSDDLEPTRAEDINRESGTTTFNHCSWCKHSGGGTCRYQFMISGSCSLMNYLKPEGTDYDDPEWSYGFANHECKVRQLSEEQLQELLDKVYAEREREYFIQKRKGRVQNHLRKLQKKSQSRPYLASLRPHDHFNIGDRVVSWIKPRAKMSDGVEQISYGFIVGTVIAGYRHHDGCVSFMADSPFHTGEYGDGKGSGAGVARADIVLLDDFLRLVKDKDFADFWLDNHEDRVCPDDFADALLEAETDFYRKTSHIITQKSTAPIYAQGDAREVTLDFDVTVACTDDNLEVDSVAHKDLMEKAIDNYIHRLIRNKTVSEIFGSSRQDIADELKKIINEVFDCVSMEVVELSFEPHRN